MLNAHFYTFAKKPNSTKLVNVAYATYAIVLKENTSIINPVIRLNSSKPITYNYCYIPEFNRYYFVGNWISETNNVWSASLTEDYLATWRTQMLSSSQFVLRSASESDDDIVDMMYPTTTKLDIRKTAIPRPFLNGNDMRYIIGVSNATSNNKVGGCTYYNMTFGQFSDLMSLLLGSSSYLGDFSLDSISDSLVKSLVNPLQYIGETFILPYNIGDGTLDLLTCGWWVVDTNYAYPVLTNSKVLHQHEIWRHDISLPAHPQSSYGSYMNCAPYSEHYLYTGVFGMIKLDSTVLHNCARIELVLYGDFKGNIQLDIIGHHNINGVLTPVLVDRHETNCAVPISLTQTNNKPEKAIELGLSGLSALGHTATANPKGLCSDIANGLESAQDFFIPKNQGRPSMGSIEAALEDWEIISQFKNITEIAPNLYGRPLCHDKILNTLSGYCKCNNAYIEIAGTKEEAQALINYMNGGFFIE